MKLRKNIECLLFPTPPFSFDPTFHKPDHFPSSDTKWESGIRWQTMLWRGKPLGLKFVRQGTVTQPKIFLTVFSECILSDEFINSLKGEIIYRYDLESDLTEFSTLFRKDSQLGPILQKWPGMRVMSPQSLYEFLIIGIVLQNCTVKRSVMMMQTLFKQFGKKLEFDGLTLYCFWNPKELLKSTEDHLRSLKVGYRAKSFLRISEPFAYKDIDELDLRTKSKEEQQKSLLNLFGVGPATVGYILFEVFKHLDEFDHISPWEQKIYSNLFFGADLDRPIPVQKLLTVINKCYGKYSRLAVHYIWEDLWWKRKNEDIPWLEKLIRL